MSSPRPALSFTSEHKGIAFCLLGVLFLIPHTLLVRLLSSMPTDALMFWRALPQALGLFVFSIVVLRARPPFLPLFFLMAAIYSLESLFFLFSVVNTYVANTLLFLSSAPLLAALAAWLLWRERLARQTFYAILATSFGLGLFVFGGIGGGHMLGDALAFGAALMLTGFFLCARRMTPSHSILATSLGSTVLCLLFLPSAVDFGIPQRETLYPFLAMQLIQPFGIAFFAIGARYIPAVEVTLILLLEPIFAPFLVWLVVGEIPGLETFIGGGISFSAISLWCFWRLHRLRRAQALREL